jgi:hypothetical protein
MVRESNGGIAGNGIYFAETASERDNKAQASGIVIELVVKLGSVNKFRQLVMHQSLSCNF